MRFFLLRALRVLRGEIKILTIRISASLPGSRFILHTSSFILLFVDCRRLGHEHGLVGDLPGLLGGGVGGGDYSHEAGGDRVSLAEHRGQELPEVVGRGAEPAPCGDPSAE